MDPRVRPWRLGATMFAAFGAAAMLVAAAGRERERRDDGRAVAHYRSRPFVHTTIAPHAPRWYCAGVPPMPV